MILHIEVISKVSELEKKICNLAAKCSGGESVSLEIPKIKDYDTLTITCYESEKQFNQCVMETLRFPDDARRIIWDTTVFGNTGGTR